MEKRYIEATQEAGIALFSRKISGEVIMLNLLRFRKVADYIKNPDLAPSEPVSGRIAYQKYIDHTLPFLKESGGSIIFIGEGGKYLIGPQDEQWDMVMLIRQKSVSNFVAFASNQEYLAGIAHRTAALEDSRLLPLVEMSIPT
ncbi:MAG TPA: DUF1330 domain-containing protein [Nitrospirota bacterium]|nr:DUF1330 domain-containing protein [Nitrospirota bacterium]